MQANNSNTTQGQAARTLLAQRLNQRQAQAKLTGRMPPLRDCPVLVYGPTEQLMVVTLGFATANGFTPVN